MRLLFLVHGKVSKTASSLPGGEALGQKILAPLFSLELGGTLFEKRFRAFAHVFGGAADGKECGFEEEAFFLRHFHSVLDRLDRYQTIAGANQVYDEEARKKLFDKINRVAANLDVDEVMQAAAREHLRKLGMIPNEPGASEGDAAAGAPEAPEEEKI